MGLGWERQMLSTWLLRRHCHRWYARFEEEEEVWVVVIFPVMHEPLCEAPLTLGTCGTNVICVMAPWILCAASACVSAGVCTSIKFNFLLSRQNFDVYFCHAWCALTMTSLLWWPANGSLECMWFKTDIMHRWWLLIFFLVISWLCIYPTFSPPPSLPPLNAALQKTG